MAFVEVLLPKHSFVSKTKLSKLCKQIFQPSVQKQFNVLKKAWRKRATVEALPCLKDNTKSSDLCQRINNAWNCCWVFSGAENVRFDGRILLCVMYMDSRPILSNMYEGDKTLSSLIPERCVAKNYSIKTISVRQAAIIIGLPTNVLVGQGVNFGPLFYGNWCTTQYLNLKDWVWNTFKSRGVAERYHQPLRSICSKIATRESRTGIKYAFSLSVKAMNETLRPGGLWVHNLYPGNSRELAPALELLSNVPLYWAVKSSQVHKKRMRNHVARMRINRAPDAQHWFQPTISLFLGPTLSLEGEDRGKSH